MSCSQLIDWAAILWHHEDYAHKENDTVNMEKLLYLISGLWHSFGSSFAHLLPDVVGLGVRSSAINISSQLSGFSSY